MTQHERPLRFFKSVDTPCSYLPGRQASSVYANPDEPLDADLYDLLLHQGFRRSGELIYRPDCKDCDACIPVRLRIADFTPARRHKRTLARNADISLSVARPQLTEEYFTLYSRYLQAQHPGGGMDEHDEQAFRDFLVTDSLESRFVELRDAGQQLLAVAVTDVVSDGLSCVYTFYDPAQNKRSPGVLAILQQIELARAAGLPYLYLGYWISDCRKMAYKKDYQPLEYFTGEPGWLDAAAIAAGALDDQ
ncbi:arginyltransferase [Granulosicoccaceae sp. 1_MG-2023]|nr:arginyltransferase [Granulosicoccaceae sp. 1_MG-2023]